MVMIPQPEKKPLVFIDLTDTINARNMDQKPVTHQDVKNATATAMANDAYSNTATVLMAGASGAAAGSIIPGLGTALGAGLGVMFAAAGLTGMTYYDQYEKASADSKREFWKDFGKEERELLEKSAFERGYGIGTTLGTTPKDLKTGELMEGVGEMAGSLGTDAMINTMIGGKSFIISMGINAAATEFNERVGMGESDEAAFKGALANGVAVAGSGAVFMKAAPYIFNRLGVIAKSGIPKMTATGAEFAGWEAVSGSSENFMLAEMGLKPKEENNFSAEEFVGIAGLGFLLGATSVGLGKIAQGVNKARKKAQGRVSDVFFNKLDKTLSKKTSESATKEVIDEFRKLNRLEQLQFEVKYKMGKDSNFVPMAKKLSKKEEDNFVKIIEQLKKDKLISTDEAIVMAIDKYGDPNLANSEFINKILLRLSDNSSSIPNIIERPQPKPEPQPQPQPKPESPIKQSTVKEEAKVFDIDAESEAQYNKLKRSLKRDAEVKKNKKKIKEIGKEMGIEMTYTKRDGYIAEVKSEVVKGYLTQDSLLEMRREAKKKGLVLKWTAKGRKTFLKWYKKIDLDKIIKGE
jgi:hypothetical protein